MSRPSKKKKIEHLPHPVVYMPSGWTDKNVPIAEIAIEDFEALRLIDGEGCNLNEAARRLSCSRSTAGRMVERARRILAQALAAQAPICIDAGENSNFASRVKPVGQLGDLAAAVTGENENAPVAGIFGRAPYFAIYSREKSDFQFIANPGKNMKRGASRASVKLLQDAGVRRVAAGRFGPDAIEALAQAKIEPLLLSGLSLRQFHELYLSE